MRTPRSHAHQLAALLLQADYHEYSDRKSLNTGKLAATGRWLEMASGCKQVEYDKPNYGVGYTYCRPTYEYELRVNSHRQSLALTALQYFHIWGALETLLIAIHPPDTPNELFTAGEPRDKRWVNIQYYLKTRYDSTFEIPADFLTIAEQLEKRLDDLASEDQNLPRYSYVSKMRKSFELKTPWHSKSGLALRVCRMARNSYYHAQISDFPDSGEAKSDSQLSSVFHDCCHLVLFTIQMLACALLKDQNPVIAQYILFLNIDDDRDEIPLLPLLMRAHDDSLELL